MAPVFQFLLSILLDRFRGTFRQRRAIVAARTKGRAEAGASDRSRSKSRARDPHRDRLTADE
jgi:hypothetical protein